MKIKSQTQLKIEWEKFCQVYEAYWSALGEGDGIPVWKEWICDKDIEIVLRAIPKLARDWTQNRKPKLQAVKNAYLSFSSGSASTIPERIKKEKCPTCLGSGWMYAVFLVVDGCYFSFDPNPMKEEFSYKWMKIPCGCNIGFKRQDNEAVKMDVILIKACLCISGWNMAFPSKNTMFKWAESQNVKLVKCGGLSEIKKAWDYREHKVRIMPKEMEANQ